MDNIWNPWNPMELQGVFQGGMAIEIWEIMG